MCACRGCSLTMQLNPILPLIILQTNPSLLFQDQSSSCFRSVELDAVWRFQSRYTATLQRCVWCFVRPARLKVRPKMSLSYTFHQLISVSVEKKNCLNNWKQNNNSTESTKKRNHFECNLLLSEVVFLSSLDRLVRTTDGVSMITRKQDSNDSSSACTNTHAVWYTAQNRRKKVVFLLVSVPFELFFNSITYKPDVKVPVRRRTPVCIHSGGKGPRWRTPPSFLKEKTRHCDVISWYQ